MEIFVNYNTNIMFLYCSGNNILSENSDDRINRIIEEKYEQDKQNIEEDYSQSLNKKQDETYALIRNNLEKISNLYDSNNSQEFIDNEIKSYTEELKDINNNIDKLNKEIDDISKLLEKFNKEYKKFKIKHETTITYNEQDNFQYNIKNINTNIKNNIEKIGFGFNSKEKDEIMKYNADKDIVIKKYINNINNIIENQNTESKYKTKINNNKQQLKHKNEEKKYWELYLLSVQNLLKKHEDKNIQNNNKQDIRKLQFNISNDKFHHCGRSCKTIGNNFYKINDNEINLNNNRKKTNKTNPPIIKKQTIENKQTNNQQINNKQNTANQETQHNLKNNNKEQEQEIIIEDNIITDENKSECSSSTNIDCNARILQEYQNTENQNTIKNEDNNDNSQVWKILAAIQIPIYSSAFIYHISKSDNNSQKQPNDSITPPVDNDNQNKQNDNNQNNQTQKS